MRISANGAFAHVEYVFAAIKGYKKIALIYSCFERSEIALRGFTANISIGNVNLYPDKDAGGDIMIFPNPDKPEKFFAIPPRFRYNKEKRWRMCSCYLQINTLTRFMARSLVMTA